ncbi:hypothetical protein CLAFUW4_05813 [Fulvia fulva]|uniref:Uncharacterized protein n=1 Tax=Passalora fulva TaxID=5499 RepID=A0A9Q8LGM9_PASFU|nr:uncharacterized protein CLAFUR5_05954 [Fulvia fulva]KAK4623761.1 hypothetical protein CLAFUR4_05807 [Fulvia fulva]KAK4625125.1 hypothetical protein CLAFUR0_05818 [Fulvia fulva]UJO17286.1 hypothetical protein CLAFUR5_05954 [Fulvia fulva]WPV15573.1 hypothetical protein CLAFUW4_05813 [Fulvia fulva]WPV29642.1 hypothetical protein CLAFUW7_05811 [Fulvia fulva]
MYLHMDSAGVRLRSYARGKVSRVAPVNRNLIRAQWHYAWDQQVMLRSALTGNDKLGNQCIGLAYTLQRMLPMPELEERSGTEARNYCRARRVAAGTIEVLEGLYAAGIQYSTRTQPIEMVEVDTILPSTTTLFWEAYPLRKEAIPLKINLLLSARNALGGILGDTVQILLFNRSQHSMSTLLQTTRTVIQRLDDWGNELPKELRRVPEMPIASFDLQWVNLVYNAAGYRFD